MANELGSWPTRSGMVQPSPLGRLRFALGLVLTALMLGTCQLGGSGSSSPIGMRESPPPRLFSGLGNVHLPITTKQARTQQYFDQGLALVYGFNHEGAIDSFQEGARLDPDCAMCFWGIGLAYGPNINAPMGPEAGRAAYAATQRALALSGGASEHERAYIDALAKRYAEDPAANRGQLDLAFADAMRDVVARFPDDLHARTIFAEALMDLSPWDYWTDDAKPRAHTEELLAQLRTVLEREPSHTGANHYLIHALEEYEPTQAEAAADRLAKLAPEAGHLVHMPSHIYWRVGRYPDAVAVNERAASADVAYFAWCRSPQAYAAGYYNHNLHFLWAASAVQGQSDRALTAARRLAANIPTSAVPTYPFLEDFLPMPIFTLARFGRWDAILGEPKPDPSLPYVTAIWHYARGLAFARTGRREAAQGELALLEKTARDPAQAQNVFDVAGGTAGQRLTIGMHHLAGEIALAGGDLDLAIQRLQQGVKAQDAMNYIEPPAWYFPLRQALGAVLLQARRPKEAEAVYRADLDQYPKNGWSLLGLAQSLRAQGRPSDALLVDKGFETAWAHADVELTSSRF